MTTAIFPTGTDTPAQVTVNSDNSLSMGLSADLKTGAKSLALTMSSSVGSVPIPDTARFVGVRPAATTMRVGLEAPEADGAVTGAGAAGDFKKGVPVYANEWSWFNIGTGTSRTLSVRGGASDVIEVCYI